MIPRQTLNYTGDLSSSCFTVFSCLYRVVVAFWPFWMLSLVHSIKIGHLRILPCCSLQVYHSDFKLDSRQSRAFRIFWVPFQQGLGSPSNTCSISHFQLLYSRRLELVLRVQLGVILILLVYHHCLYQYYIVSKELDSESSCSIEGQRTGQHPRALGESIMCLGYQSDY